MSTVNKRETSFEGLASQMENGEDGVYSLINEDKNTIFKPKISITKNDLDTIPSLRQLRESIGAWEQALKRSSGKSAFVMKKALIEMRKDQYLIKQAYQKPITLCKITRQTDFPIPLDDTSTMDENNDEVIIQGVSLMDPKIVQAILCDYSRLKQDTYDQFNSDLHYLIQDFETVCDKALKPYPIYLRIVELKIDKRQNIEIQRALDQEFGHTYSVEYISSLWRNKIPKLIAQTAKDDFITWYYKKNNLRMKKCTRCGKEKPANNNFFSRNKSNKDNLYSICKECRRNKVKKKQNGVDN